ncbi:synaptotagmin-2 [Nomia melanderi]|uniref:synaptotagmin-2 n=1 Tax=Nomia melanderi TaxID=2448451 RepID=UPI00130450FA|nr:synaptotagmin-1 [Nomia melanderi]XP_031830716.1 synaptotagmin-1 [Nomia melanderi]XP_031830717.1 synaptotagmin-1 [Nomia melanderi]XP_031830718.1 synaptotagmin-1 [Nomia melanderi]XP_031830719.1 synaptotagmin-1 [Nomia melanderi]
MDVHNIGIVAVLGIIGAATGATSAVLVYLTCIRHRRSLNWFEKDLLNRAEEATQLSKDVFIGLGSNVSLNYENKENEIHSDDEEWKSNYVLDMLDSITKDSPKRVLQYLSESEDVSSPISTFAPPLPEGTVAASEKRMIIVKSSKNTNNSCSRLDSSENEMSSHKLSSSTSTSSSDEARGELEFGLIYDASAGILTVRLIEAYDLHPRELSGSADPYAKVRLLPDWNNIWQTRIHRRTLKPVFDEDFVFEIIPDSTLVEKTLDILLYDFDAFSRHHCLGYVRLPLSSVIDLLDTTLTVIRKPILQYGIDNELKIPSLGELMVSLSYQPAVERLTVIVVRAKNLPSLNDSTNANLYVKVKIIHDGKSIKKKKSNIQRETLSPVWNDILSFDIDNNTLSKCILEFIILRANGELLAKCEVSDKYQKELFYRVLSGKGASAQWLPLTEPEICYSDFIEQKY